MKAYVASHLKDMNRQKVYNLIRSKETTSRAEISKITGISAPTVIKIVNYLLENGLVVEIGEAETAIGRRPQMLQLNTNLMYSAGFVLEGDFLSMGIMDIAGNVIYKKHIQIESDYDYIMSQIKERFVEDLLRETELDMDKLFGIGIALPVVYDKERNTISRAPMIHRKEEFCLEPDMQELKEKYHAMIMVENDVNAQTIGEFQNVGYHAKDDLLFISAGTGLGGGLIIEGKLRRGANYMGGEIGYTSFDGTYQNRNDSAGWLEDTIGYRHLREKFGVDVTNGEEEIQPEVKAAIIEYVAKPVAMCISNLNVCLDCRNIVLGGKIAEVMGLPLLNEINKYLGRMSIHPTNVRLESSEDVGLMGLSWLLTNKKIIEILTREA